jgi:hypothetical protein
VPYLIFYSVFFLVILLTILVSVAYHIVRDVCWESNRSKRYGQLACSTCVLPEATPSKVGAEVEEGGFVEAAHSSVVEVISKAFTFNIYICMEFVRGELEERKNIFLFF